MSDVPRPPLAKLFSLGAAMRYSGRLLDVRDSSNRGQEDDHRRT